MTNCKDTSNSIIMDIDRLQLLELLAQKCDEWTRGESSSLPAEKAQDILTSILYVISLARMRAKQKSRLNLPSARR